MTSFQTNCIIHGEAATNWSRCRIRASTSSSPTRPISSVTATGMGARLPTTRTRMAFCPASFVQPVPREGSSPLAPPILAEGQSLQPQSETYQAKKGRPAIGGAAVKFDLGIGSVARPADPTDFRLR